MLIVQKYGGTSVGNPERIRNVARRVVRTKEEGHDVVVVVSAMSGETDKLINLANQVSENPDPREMDMLVSTGERVTIALLAMAIQSLMGRRRHRQAVAGRLHATPSRAPRGLEPDRPEGLPARDVTTNVASLLEAVAHHSPDRPALAWDGGL
ncbi:MAG TPA: hypothetical protein VIX18_07565, partial [Nitrospirota bacterium]